MAWRKAEDAKREQAYAEERRRILRTGGIEALDFLQREAFEADRCGWYDDDQTSIAVCQTRVTAATAFVWCARHNRQLEREAKAWRAAKKRQTETEWKEKGHGKAT